MEAWEMNEFFIQVWDVENCWGDSLLKKCVVEVWDVLRNGLTF